MTYEYAYNETLASQADDVALRIDTSGAYVGVFTCARVFTNDKGNEAVEFDFKTNDGNRARFNLYLRRADGSELFGQRLLQAMMTVLGQRGLRTSTGLVEMYENGERIEVEGERFMDLESKKIGLILQKETYSKTNGGTAFRMNIYGVFHPETRLTASEIREHKATPMKYERILRALKDKDTRTVKDEPSQPPVSGSGF